MSDHQWTAEGSTIHNAAHDAYIVVFVPEPATRTTRTDLARRVAAALNGTADVEAARVGDWQVNSDGHPMRFDPDGSIHDLSGILNSEDEAALVALIRRSALNGTADLIALAKAVVKHEAEPGIAVWKDRVVAAARTLVASTGTETDDVR
jgi:hypothetical protein